MVKCKECRKLKNAGKGKCDGNPNINIEHKCAEFGIVQEQKEGFYFGCLDCANCYIHESEINFTEDGLIICPDCGHHNFIMRKVAKEVCKFCNLEETCQKNLDFECKTANRFLMGIPVDINI